MGRRRRGTVAVLAGPDGAGKTVIGVELVPRLDREVRVLWQRPSILPRKTPIEGVDGSTPHDVAIYSRAMSWFKVFYVFVDYLLGWFVHVRPFVRRGGVVLLERSWWDMAVDPYRYRLQGAVALVTTLGWFVPRAGVVLLLEAPPEAIYERRGELSIGEIGRQVHTWKQLLTPRLRPHVVDTMQPLEASVEEARVAILQACGGE